MTKKVIIYTTTYCPWCQATKEFFSKMGIEYEEKNVELNQEWAEEMVKESGQFGVPVVIIANESNGEITKKKVIIGFSPEEFTSALNEINENEGNS